MEAQTFWRQFFDGITAPRDARGMTVIMIAHSQVQRVEDPTLPAYDRHGLKLHKRASALAEKFADVVLYAPCRPTPSPKTADSTTSAPAHHHGRARHAHRRSASVPCQVPLLASLATAADLGSVRTGHAAGCACSQSGLNHPETKPEGT